MRITATLSKNTNGIDEIIYNGEIIDIATRGNIIVINNVSYFVCRTLFTKYFYDGKYDLDQVITTYNRTPSQPFELFLLSATINFDEEEKSFLLKEVVINYYNEDNNHTYEEVKLLYNYIRHLDCVRIGNSALVCNEIKVLENKKISIDLTTKHPVSEFRYDKNGFCQHI